MPDTIVDINKCSIEEDQFRVATQWAKTFIHNPMDLANNMTQLVMACVARGDFKIRDYMSNTSELHAPSQQLTIADYLSHASRIIINYNSLSEEYAQELLSYFPEASTTNKVFSRSATHDVNQVNEKVVEGKGVMIGVKGQLPALIKTPHDFGLNIAMGGMGEDNFNGKKISANGFSGHFYYHRNTEHKLLLAGLEQTAPSVSALDLLRGVEKYPEEEQQGHDQFDQGHSLTGASDTYTAAGSLYFSNPIYQAKLLLEKGVFPPDKYGAMQVTITDENWLLIKDFLKALRASAESGNHDEVIGTLLESPLSAQASKVEYMSYVALDFTSYLKQVYKVFIADSEIRDEDKSSLATEQIKLLTLIKELQFGNLAAYKELDGIIEQIRSTDNIAEEYKQALTRISDLFILQLTIDPQLENTQMIRPYRWGDYTWTTLSKIHHAVNDGEGEDDSPKEYEFGDITWGVLNRINQSKKDYHWGDISYGVLSRINKAVNGSDKDYQFGDIVSGLRNRWRPSTLTPERVVPSPEETVSLSQPGFRVVDYTRHLIWGPSITAVKPTPEKDKDNDTQTEPKSTL
jgi:hypothetical protein